MHYIILFFLLCYSSITFSGWPVFHPPTRAEITALITNDCQPGYGRIKPHSRLKISNHYIPSDETWYWIYTGDGECQKLTGSLIYTTFEQTGRHSPNQILISYGSLDKKKIFTFAFTIPYPYWDCGPFAGSEPPQEIGCAQDTLKTLHK